MKICLMVLAICSTTVVRAESIGWTSFRNGGSSQAGGNYPETWSPESGVAWQRELPGYGQSAPVTWKNRVYLTAVVGDHKETCTVICLDVTSGKELWKTSRPATQQALSDYRVSRAAPTPVVDESGVYAFFESGDLLALDHHGKTNWERSLSSEYGKFENHHGLGSSPAHYRHLLFLNIEHRGDSYLIAVHKSTGKNVWKVPRPSGMSWTSPLVLTTSSQPQLLVSSSGSVTSYDLLTGKQYWQLGELGGNSVPSPTAEGNLVFVGARVSEFGTNAQAARSNLCLRVSSDPEKPLEVLWRADKAVCDYASPVVCADCVYLLNNVGVLYCLDQQTGKQHYAKRLPVQCWATPIVCGGKLYFFGRDGQTLVVTGGPEFSQSHLNRLWQADNPPLPEVYREAQAEQSPGRNRSQRLVAMLLRGDANKDGKLTPDEMPPTMKDQFADVDLDQDGLLDQEELNQMQEQFAARRRDSRSESRDPIVYGVAATQGRFLIRTGTRLFCVEGAK